jgi:hypothetical protein
MTALVPTAEEFDKLSERVAKLEDSINVSPGPGPQPEPQPEPEPVPPEPGNPYLYDNFNYNETFQVGKQSNNKKWLLQFTSGGYAKADTKGCVLAPGGTELTIYSGSVLLRSTKKATNYRVTFHITNEKQLYTKDKSGNTITPPGWHAPWPFGRYVDKYRHWYVIIGRDKVEMGKKDAPTNITNQQEIEKYQFTLWTGPPATPIGTRRKVTMEFIKNKFTVYIDDKLIKTLVDDGNLTSNGVKIKQSDWTTGDAFGLYNEGCQGRYQDIIIEDLP